MISEEKLLKTVNASVAEMLTEQIMRKLNATLEQKWSAVVSELVNSRKTSVALQETLKQSQQQNRTFEMLLRRKEVELQRNKTAQAKASRILDEALTQLGYGE